MSDREVLARFIDDEAKLNLNRHDLFDKIINLKINCYDEKSGMRESFVIRSDYELVYPDSSVPTSTSSTESLGNRYLIRRCTMKPSIKVQYKMVAKNTGINVNVYISNFFMLTKDGKHIRSFNSAKYKIESVKIVMGYWGQLKRNKEEKPMTYKDYFNIEAKGGADSITIVEPIVVTMDKLPPDSVLHLKGYVAGIYDSPIAVSKITTAEKAKDHPIAKSEDSVQAILYRVITRRYLNLHTLDSTESDSKKLERVSAIKNFPVKVKYDETTGLMDDKEAEAYGVKVYVTKRLKDIQLPKVIDGNGEEKPKRFHFEQGWTIGMTIARLSTFLQYNLSYTFNNKGEALIYLTDEVNDPDSLYQAFVNSDMYKSSVFSEAYNNKLPAVYNINVDAVTTIVCPFFTFLNPFEDIEFASRYALTSVVSYFANYSSTNYKFRVISASISFATVEDVNEVQITAVTATEKKN